MKEEAFKIFVEQLRNGHTEHVDIAPTPDFLDVSDRDLSYRDPVKIEGDAYLAGDALVLHFVLETQATIQCTICNEPIKVEISIPDFYHMEPLEEIKTGIFSFLEIVREAIILQTPPFAECNEGKCSHRKEIQKYLANAKQEKVKEEGYHPFADL